MLSAIKYLLLVYEFNAYFWEYKYNILFAGFFLFKSCALDSQNRYCALKTMMHGIISLLKFSLNLFYHLLFYIQIAHIAHRFQISSNLL